MLWKLEIAVPFEFQVGVPKDDLRSPRAEFLGPLEALVGPLVSSLFGEETGQIDQSPHLVRRDFDSAAQLVFRASVFLAFLGQFGKRPMAFARIYRENLVGQRSSLIVAAAEKARGFQIIFEKIS